jgi:DNA-binding MarR family transcriptional regulator
LRRAYHRAKANTTGLLRGLGVTPVQAAALMALAQRGPLSQADLGRTVGMEPGNTHGLVARLTDLGVIETRPHPRDQRQVRVVLTRRGERQAQAVAERTLRSGEQTLAVLSPAERATFLLLLARVALAEDGEGT